MLSQQFKKSILSLKRIGRTAKRFELFLNLTYKCPLRCTYCYVDYERAPSMTQEHVDFIMEEMIAKPNNNDIKLVTFFGGEPALEMDIIENTVKKWYNHPKFKNIHFGVITGFSVHQDRLLNLQREYPLLEIAISFDVDMRDRPFLNNKPFNLLNQIKKKYDIDLESMSKNNNNIFFNKIVTGQENDLYGDLEWLHNNYKKYGIFYSISFNKTPKFLFPLDGVVTDSWYRYLKLCVLPYIRSEKNAFMPQLLLQYFRRWWEKESNTAVSGCGLASEYFIDSNGTVSPCSISHHKTDLMLAHEGKFLDNLEHFQTLESSYWNNPTCQSCKYKGFCPGGCMVFRHMENGDYNKPNVGQCMLMEEVYNAYDRFLAELSENDLQTLKNLVFSDLSKYYEYCHDNSTHIDLHDIFKHERVEEI